MGDSSWDKGRRFVDLRSSELAVRTVRSNNADKAVKLLLIIEDNNGIAGQRVKSNDEDKTTNPNSIQKLPEAENLPMRR